MNGIAYMYYLSIVFIVTCLGCLILKPWFDASIKAYEAELYKRRIGSLGTVIYNAKGKKIAG